MAHIDNHPPVKEADLFERIKWLSSEFMLQGQRFRDAASILETQRVSSSMEGVRAAKTTLVRIHDQASALIDSLGHAIDLEDKRQKVNGRVS